MTPARICPHTKEGARCGLNRCVPDCPIRTALEEAEGKPDMQKPSQAQEWISKNLWNVIQFAITIGAFAAVLWVANARAQDKAAAISAEVSEARESLKAHTASADAVHREFREDVDRIDDRLRSMEWNAYVICITLQKTTPDIRCSPPATGGK